MGSLHAPQRSRPLPLAGLLALLALVPWAGTAQAATATSATPLPTATTQALPTITTAAPSATAPPTTTTLGASPTLTSTQPLTSSQAGAKARQPSHRGGSTSGAAIAIAVLAGLLALACLAWGLARWAAYEPRWTVSLRHAMGEAGYRASATWAEFTDWARLGR
jgi:hypothetical protein